MKIIGIAGGTGMGKSLFAYYLAQKLGTATILSLDHYYLERPAQVSKEKYHPELPTAFDFKAYHQALEDLRAGLPIQMPQYDLALGKRKPGTVRVHPTEYLILEGLYILMHGSLRALLSYSFFLESPPDTTLARLILRAQMEHQQKAEETIQYYFHVSRPAFHNYVLPTRQYANLVVTNDYSSRLDLFLDDFLSNYRI